MKSFSFLAYSSMLIGVFCPAVVKSESLEQQFNNQSACNPSRAQYRYNNNYGEGGGFTALFGALDAQSMLAEGAPVQVTSNGDIFMASSSSNCIKLGSLNKPSFKPVPNPDGYNCSIIKTEWSLSEDKSALYEFLQVGQVAYVSGTSNRTFTPCSNPFASGVTRKTHSRLESYLYSKIYDKPSKILECPSMYEGDDGNMYFLYSSVTPDILWIISIKTKEAHRTSQQGKKEVMVPYLRKNSPLNWGKTDAIPQSGTRILKNLEIKKDIIKFDYLVKYGPVNDPEREYENQVVFGPQAYYLEKGYAKDKVACKMIPWVPTRENVVISDGKTHSPVSLGTRYNPRKSFWKKSRSRR